MSILYCEKIILANHSRIYLPFPHRLTNSQIELYSILIIIISISIIGIIIFFKPDFNVTQFLCINLPLKCQVYAGGFL